MCNQTNKILLRVDGLTKRYGETIAVDNISFELEEKGFVFINGISGSGKTTLMNMIAGLDSSTSGNVFYNEKNITKLGNTDLADYRNSEIGIVFQNFNLIDEISVEENLLLPLTIQAITEEQKNKLVEKVLDFVGLRGYGKRKGYELSAGQKQRVAIARAIIKRPKVIFADEATGNLDSKNAEQILRLFNSISKNCLVVLISHNIISAKKYADRIITLDNGTICRDIDNRQMKELYLEPYRISVTGDDYSSEMPLEDFDIKLVIKDYIQKTGKKAGKYNFNTEICLEKNSTKEKYNWSKGDNTITRNMPLVEILKCILRIVKKNKIKNFFASCLFSFVILLFFFIAVIGANDYYRSLSRCVNNDNKTLYNVKKVADNKTGKNDIYRGRNIYTKLEEVFGTDNVIECIGELSLNRDESNFYAIAFKYGELFEHFAITGIWPSKINEVAICKQLSDNENIIIGSYISNEEKSYKVVGIYDSSSIIKENSVVLYKYINSELLEQGKILNLQACNVLKSIDLEEYVSECVNIGKVSDVKDQELIWGRMPEKSSEILVSSDILQECGMNLEDNFVTKYRLHNLYDEKYNSEYEEFVNMYDYLGKNVEIVGVFNAENNYDFGEILIQDSIYLEILNYQCKYLDYECLYVNIESDDSSYYHIKAMKKDNIYLSDDVCIYIYEIQEFFYSMKSVLKILSAVMLIMLVFVVVSFLSYNIKDYSKTVGIYKSLGIRNIDIAKIFIIQNMLITIFAIILANMGLGGVMSFINTQIFEFYKMPHYEVFVLDKFFYLIINIFVVLISILATVIPINRMVKKESVALINREES